MQTSQRRRQSGSRLNGKFRGLVVDRNDPERRKRIRARVPRIDLEYVTVWALPCGLHPQDHNVPAIGDQVWIEFEAGDARFPIWSYGFTPVAQDVPEARAFASDNVTAGRRVVGHEDGGALIFDATEGDQRVFVRSSDQESRVGVSSLQDSVYVVGKTDGLIKTGGNLIERIGGGRDTVVNGIESIAVTNNAEKAISGTREETVGEDDLLVVNGVKMTRSAKNQVLDVINAALVVLAGIRIDQIGASGEVELSILNGVSPGSIKLSGSGPLVKCEIDVSGEVTVNAGLGKVKFSGAPIGSLPGTHGVLLADVTIDRFTGTPFVAGPGGGSLTVEATS